jgi:hypothetical protein
MNGEEYIFDLKKELREDLRREDIINELIEKIDELEIEAKEIENNIVELINGVNIEENLQEIDPRDLEYIDPMDLSLESYKLKSPNEDFDKFNREIVRKYQRWYTTAEMIINYYLSERLNEFRRLKFGGSTLTDYGIIDVLQLKPDYLRKPEKKEIIKELCLRFDQQRDILIALGKSANIIPSVKLKKKKVPEKLPISTAAHTTIIQGDVQGPMIVGSHNEITVDNRRIIENFEKLKVSIEQIEIEPEKRSALLSQLEKLNQTKGTPEYINSFKEFFETAANLVAIGGALYPVSQFLWGLLQL